jgi:hypothetical protein
MLGRWEHSTAVVATVAGSIAGAVSAFMLIDLILTRIEGGPASVVALLCGWLVLSVAAGASSYAATAAFSRSAAPIAISVFVWIGLLVYPGTVVHLLFDVPVPSLVVGGAALAGLTSAVLVYRVETA